MSFGATVFLALLVIGYILALLCAAAFRVIAFESERAYVFENCFFALFVANLVLILVTTFACQHIF